MRSQALEEIQLQSIHPLVVRSVNVGWILQLLLVIAEQSLGFSPYDSANDEILMLSPLTE